MKTLVKKIESVVRNAEYAKQGDNLFTCLCLYALQTMNKPVNPILGILLAFIIAGGLIGAMTLLNSLVPFYVGLAVMSAVVIPAYVGVFLRDVCGRGRRARTQCA